MQKIAGVVSRDYLSAFYRIKGIIRYEYLKQCNIFNRGSGFYVTIINFRSLRFLRSVFFVKELKCFSRLTGICKTNLNKLIRL